MATWSSPDQPAEDDRAFLEHFPSTRRSYVANTFLYSIRAGARTPLQVLADVDRTLRETAQRAQRWNITGLLERTEEVYTALHEYHSEALAYAGYCLRWEQLAPAEKEQIRAVKAEPHIRAYMEQQAPTDKQLAYLRKLGYTGEVTSKQHASELIDTLRQQRRAA